MGSDPIFPIPFFNRQDTMKTNTTAFGVLALLFSGTLFAQAAPVVAVDDPE